MKTEVLEKLFKEKFPEYVVYGKPLSEYFELFKSGYELSELKIAKLEDEVERLVEVNTNLVYHQVIAKVEKLRGNK